MKKFFALFFLVVVLFFSWKGWEYYQSTYVGKDYYAIIQAPLPPETDIKDAHGEVYDRGYKYNVVGFDTKGNRRNLDFTVTTSGEYANGSKLEEGTILRLKASEKRIIEQQIITKDKVPANLKPKLGIS